MPQGHAVHLERHWMIGMSFHDGFRVLPFPPFPQKFVYLDFFHQIRGWDNWQSKLSTKVLGPGAQELVGKDSDMGLMVPHVPIIAPPLMDLMWPITFLMSSSVSKLGSRSVVMKNHSQWNGDDTDPVAVCWWPCAPFSQNIGCNDPVDMPLDFVISPNSIEVAVTCDDIVDAVVEILVDAAVGKVMDVGGKMLFKRVGGPVKKQVKKFKAARKQAKVDKKVIKVGDEAFEKSLKKQRRQGAAPGESLLDVEQRAQRRANRARRKAESKARRKAAREEARGKARESRMKKRQERMDSKILDDRGASLTKPKTWKNVFEPYKTHPKAKSKYYRDYWAGKNPKITGNDRIPPWIGKGVGPSVGKALFGQFGDIDGRKRQFRSGVTDRAMQLGANAGLWRGDVTPDDETPDLELTNQGFVPN